MHLWDHHCFATIIAGVSNSKLCCPRSKDGCIKTERVTLPSLWRRGASKILKCQISTSFREKKNGQTYVHSFCGWFLLKDTFAADRVRCTLIFSFSHSHQKTFVKQGGESWRSSHWEFEKWMIVTIEYWQGEYLGADVAAKNVMDLFKGILWCCS